MAAAQVGRALARRLLLAVLAGAALLLLALLTGALAVVSVASSSMRPTVCEGDRLVLWQIGASSLAGRGDLVVLRSPGDGEHLLKRVVAVAGQTVELVDGRLLVDGQPAHEPFVDLESVDGTTFGPVRVGRGRVFVLGDEREHSVDSRDFGDVPRSRLVGLLLAGLGPGCTG